MRKYKSVEARLVLRIPKDLKDILLDRALVHKTSLSNEVRTILVDKLHENLRHEDKISKRLDEFESRLFGKITEEFDSSRAGVLKTNLYSITNMHLLKMITSDLVFGNDIPPISEKKTLNRLSFAKYLTLFDGVDSVNSRERFDMNIKKEHLQK